MQLLTTKIFLYICFWSINILNGQTPTFINYTVNEGLPGNIVYCGAQDSRGLIWLGTDKGLACFDGLRFRVYGMKDGLPDPEVLNMMNDTKGNLWVSCFSNNPCYITNGKVVSSKQDSILGKLEFSRGICQFFEDNRHNLWISGQNREALLLSDSGVKYFPVLRYHISRLIDINSDILGLNHDIFIKMDNGVDNQTELYAIKNDLTKKGQLFRGASVSGNRILISFSHDLLLYEYQNKKITLIKKIKKTGGGAAFTDWKGRFWICMDNGGAVCFDNDRQDLSNPVVFLAGKKITNMFADKQKTLWFCTYGEGVYMLKENAPKSYFTMPEYPSNNITALGISDYGTLNIGDDEGNLYRFKHGAIQKIATGEKGINRTRKILYTPRNNTTWFALDKGIYKVVGHENTRFIPINGVKDIFENGDKLMIATFNRLASLDSSGIMDTFSLKRTTTGAFDHLGQLWAGRINGLILQNDINGINWGEKFKDLSYRIISIKAQKDYLWVVTPENGLLKVNIDLGIVKSVFAINDSLSTPIQNVQSILAENEGTLWLGTNAGVYRIDPKMNISHFDKDDGLCNNDVNAILKQADTLWVATASGLTSLVLNAPNENGDFETYVTCMRYKSGVKSVVNYVIDSLPSNKYIKMAPDASLIEIEFAGLDYRNNGNIHFNYTINPHIPSLGYITLQNVIDYAKKKLLNSSIVSSTTSSILKLGMNFPPGEYSLDVVAVNSSGIRSKKSDKIYFLIQPYWYQTLWFYTAICILILTISWRIYKYWDQVKYLNTTVSELQLQALKSQINPHFVGNSINAIQQFFYPPNPLKASKYISTFTRLLRSTMEYSEKTFIHLKDEIQFIQDYLEMIKLRFGNRFEYFISKDENIPDSIPIPSMLLQPILENATIHGLATDGISTLKLHFSMENGRLFCKITDNGIGINASKIKDLDGKEKKQSKGIILIRNKINTINALYQIDCKINISDISDSIPSQTGTEVILSYLSDIKTTNKVKI